MVFHLTGPLVTVSVEYRNGEYHSREDIRQKAKVNHTPLELTCDVIEEADPHIGRNVLEKLLNQSERVMLALPFVRHVDGEQAAIVAAEEGHDAGVHEELRARFFAFLVSSGKRVAALVEDRGGELHARLHIVIVGRGFRFGGPAGAPTVDITFHVPQFLLG